MARLASASASNRASRRAISAGIEIFEKWCSSCHDRGDDYPGTIALGARYKGEVPAALEDRTDLTASTIEYFVRNGISVMPFFRKTEISDRELQKLSTYLTEKEH
ncbi:MAG: c-type cytochrome [Oleiphilaceae bacterium]